MLYYFYNSFKKLAKIENILKNSLNLLLKTALNT